MKKYILVACTFFAHSFINTPTQKKFISYIREEKIKEDTGHKEMLDDSLKLFRRGGIHSATWYNMHGRRTASGEKFHKDSLTAAYNFSKLGTYLKVTNLNNNQSIIVKVNDRMGNKSRNHIDLSKCAFDSIGNINSGRIKVIVEEIQLD